MRRAACATAGAKRDLINPGCLLPSTHGRTARRARATTQAADVAELGEPSKDRGPHLGVDFPWEVPAPGPLPARFRLLPRNQWRLQGRSGTV
jgi:hypothetical protein